MTFDSSTRHCTLLLGNYYIDRRGQQGPGDNIIIAMSIYDLESNAWTAVSMVVPYDIRPCGKGIYSHGKFHWVALTPNRQNLIVAFSISDGLWTAIPVPEGCRKIFPENLGQHDGQVVLVEQKEADCVRMWKLNEAEQYEIWCELRTSGLAECRFPLFPVVTVNSSGLIMVIDWKMDMSIYNSKGELIVGKMRLQGLRTSQRPVRVSVSAFESSNLWWP
jgi:hypothetical protein